MPVQVSKKGIRVLGVSESFIKGFSERSVLAGIVMRKDMIVDGFSVSYTTVGGKDATEGVLRLFNRLNRCDVNVMMLNGSVISWFNVIDLNALYTKLVVPLICVTYEESEGLEEYFKRYFDDWKERILIHRGNGERIKIRLHTGSEVFVNFLGIDKKDVKRVLDGFTFFGAVPEPLKMSRMLAKALLDAEVILT
jgi:endonuclease V-like protein UPF0215 family